MTLTKDGETLWEAEGLGAEHRGVSAEKKLGQRAYSCSWIGRIVLSVNCSFPYADSEMSVTPDLRFLPRVTALIHEIPRLLKGF